MISAFGLFAWQLEGVFPPELEAVVFDETGMTAALREAVRRRERGERFYGMALLDDQRVRVCNAVALEINRRSTDREQRYYASMQLASGLLGVDGEPVRNAWRKRAELWTQVGAVLSLADELLFHSYNERDRYAAAQDIFQSRPFRRILLADMVPAFVPRSRGGPSVVVWTGRRHTELAMLALIGLEEFRGDVCYVGDHRLQNIGAELVRRDDPALTDRLAAAGCVVCVDPSDPADAVAFARRGMSVVAPVTSGAHEFVDGVVTWDAANATYLYNAVALALGRASGGFDPDRIPTRPPAPALPPEREALPLVSIVTATYNRREYLRKMLTCLAAQTYPNIESVVVNDAGEPVDDIVAEFPFARLVNAEKNGGTLRAAELGLAAARGEYIGLLPDDDWLYPDHVERLMAAILRSGAAVAHTFSLMRFLRREPDGTDVTYGFNPLAYRATISPTQALVGTPVAGHQCLQRRDTFESNDVGWYLNDAVGADQEYHMRLVERHQLVMVDQFTCEFRDHSGNTGKRYNWSDEMRYIYEQVQPVSGRPLTEERRRDTLRQLAEIPVGENTNKPTFTF